ncbi:hypothetical protein [Psittacicella hinzii]|uniref:Porin n=1 Tax=Psittacicella hinzii TaxID=2028575 RepID=A0A3A1YE70_9GAMM|nr:hypothetical protein [Psittacicella hinzii]RIY35716.1 hypothetical protein CKF58_06500 [Psittacicella hinzii]
MLGAVGVDDAAQAWQYSDSVDIVAGARTAFDRYNATDTSGFKDKRTVRGDFKFGANKEHFLSVSYSDTKATASTSYGAQFSAVYDYRGFANTDLQAVVATGTVSNTYNFVSADFAAYYALAPNVKAQATVGYAKRTPKGTATDTQEVYAFSTEVNGSFGQYFKPAVGYSFASLQTSPLNTATTTSKEHTFYALVASDVYTYNTTTLRVGLEASYKLTNTKNNATGTKTKYKGRNVALFGQYLY